MASLAQRVTDLATRVATEFNTLRSSLGGAATKNVGTTAGTVAAGDDSRFTSAVAASRMPGLTGDVTSSAGTVATTIANGVVTFAKMATAAIATTAEFLANTASKLVSVQALWASATPQVLTDGATINWNMANGYNAEVTLGGNRTLATPTNPVRGIAYTIEIKQDGTGSRTLTFPTAFSFGAAGAPTLSTGANKVDIVTAYCLDASTPKFRCFFSKDA